MNKNLIMIASTITCLFAIPGYAASGKDVYTTACFVCHTTGAANAPKTGDKLTWAPRIKAGMEGLYGSALNGKNAMPAKGGNASLDDADVKAAVDYMVGQSQ